MRKKETWRLDNCRRGRGGMSVAACLGVRKPSAILARPIWGWGRNNPLPVMQKSTLSSKVSIDQFSAPTASFFISIQSGGVCAAQDAAAQQRREKEGARCGRRTYGNYSLGRGVVTAQPPPPSLPFLLPPSQLAKYEITNKQIRQRRLRSP